MGKSDGLFVEVQVRKVKKSDGYCICCLSSKKNEKLFAVETLAGAFRFHLCEHCRDTFEKGLREARIADEWPEGEE